MSLNIDFKVSGGEALERTIKNLAGSFPRLQRKTFEAGAAIGKEARRRVPKKTRTLLASIKETFIKRLGEAIAKVMAQAVYALWIETGRRRGPALITPKKPGAVLRFVKKTGEERFRPRARYGKKTKPQPFLVSAFKRVAPKWFEALNRIIKEILEGR